MLEVAAEMGLEFVSLESGASQPAKAPCHPHRHQQMPQLLHGRVRQVLLESSSFQLCSLLEKSCHLIKKLGIRVIIVACGFHDSPSKRLRGHSGTACYFSSRWLDMMMGNMCT